MSTEEEYKAKRTRSTNYPSLSLPKAIERAEKFYQAHRQSQVPIQVVHDVWGYTKNSSALNQCVAALKSYRLLSVNGAGEKRKLEITQDARKIFMESPDKQSILREMAVAPKIHQHVWEKYGAQGLPSDSVLKHDLCFEDEDVKFGEDAADTFIARFRETLRYAGLDSDDPEGVAYGESQSDLASETPVSAPETQIASVKDIAKVKTLSLTLIDGDAKLELPYPMSEESFDMLIGILQLQRPAFVTKLDKGAGCNP